MENTTTPSDAVTITRTICHTAAGMLAMLLGYKLMASLSGSDYELIDEVYEYKQQWVHYMLYATAGAGLIVVGLCMVRSALGTRTTSAIV